MGVDVDKGKLLWRNDEFVTPFLHPHTPLIRGNVITCIGTPNGTEASIRRLAIERSSKGIVSRELFSSNTRFVSRYTDDTVHLDDRIYESDNGLFSCFDLKSTTMRWRNRMGGSSTITYADQRFYFHGSRVISHQFEIPGVPPDKVVVAESTEDGAKHTLTWLFSVTVSITTQSLAKGFQSLKTT